MIAKQRLRELATLRPEGRKVLSIYLNFDPSQFPTPRDRKTELDSLLDTAEKGLRDDGLTHLQREELKRDLQRVRDWYEKEFDASGARGLALFASSGIDLFEVHKLSRSIGSEAVIDDSPFIEPLTVLPGKGGYSVLLANRQLARILTGDATGMREISVIVDDLRKWEEQRGGPQDRGSQDRFQRTIAKEAHDHLKRAADELFELFKRGQVRRLIIGTQPELKNEVEGALHSYLRDRIAGQIDIDTKASPAEVAQLAQGVIADDERRREQQWLDRLKSELGRGARGVRGLAATLSALNERRVEALLVREGFRTAGYATASADFLSAEPAESSQGERAVEREDVIESALESALEQSAEIVVIREAGEQLEALGSIGAVLRF